MSSTVKKILLFVGLFFVIFFASTMCTYLRQPKMPVLDFEEVGLTQLEEPKEGQEIAVIDTSEGVIKVALFREFAPKTVENFVNLANDGFYDGTYVFSNQKPENAFFLAGAHNSNGVVISDEQVENNEFSQEFLDAENLQNENEVSTDLWTLKGALVSLGLDYTGSGSFMCFINDVKVPDETIDMLRFPKKLEEGQVVNQELIDAYVDNGGILEWYQKYTVFAQTYEGIEIIEKICESELDEENPIKINSVTIQTYKK